jgi:hypothetical protein
MKFILALTLSVSSFLASNAQSGSHAVKRYARFHNDSKFIITEYVFDDGHLDNYLTAVPLTEFREGSSEQLLSEITDNIEWDEDIKADGFQMTLKNETAISSAFNNALRTLEIRLGIAQGEIGSISLSNSFLELGEDEQSYLLINEVIRALNKTERFSALQPFDERKSAVLPISEKVNESVEVRKVQSNKVASDQLSYDDLQEKENQISNALFATNGQEDLKHVNIRAIYNWIFADAYTGWYNRDKILSSNRLDKYSKPSINDLIGPNINVKIEEIIDNPTMKEAMAVSFQVVEPAEGSKYVFKFKSIKPSLTSELAADQ